MPLVKEIAAPTKAFFVVGSVWLSRGCHHDDLTSNLLRRDARMDAIAGRAGLVATRSSDG